VAAHYTARHEVRQDLFGQQPFANYGYWEREDMSLEDASAALTDLVARTAGTGPGDRVLDVGCGYGAGAVRYVGIHGAAQVIGIDVTEVRIASGRDYVAQHGLGERIELRLGDATHMEFPDHSFDRLLAVECAFHFDTRIDFMREAQRVLAPGGTLALTDIIPCRGADPRRYMSGERATGSGINLDMPLNEYDADVYAGHLAAAGFIEIRIDSILDKTRLPFSRALLRLAAAAGEERGCMLRRAADTSLRRIEAGQDYVLVSARKPAAPRV
jgi:microcystin synthetase protein McyJ